MVLALPVFAQNNEMDPDDVDVEVRYLENGDFENYDTYTITNNGNSSDDNWFSISGIDSDMVNEALQYEMDASGMSTAAEEETPDVIMNYAVFSSKWEPDAMMVTNNAIFLYMSKKYNDQAKLKEGTLVMSVLDANTGEVVWEGYAMGAVDETADMEMQKTQVRQGIAQLAERFLAFRNLGPDVAGNNGRPFRSGDY